MLSGSFLGLLEAFIHLGPIHYIPPRRQVIRPAIVVLQVIRVFPDIVAEDRVQTLRQRIVLVRSGGNREFATLPHQPSPAGAELLGRGVVERLLEVFKAAEVRLGLRGESFPVGLPPPFGAMICQNIV